MSLTVLWELSGLWDASWKQLERAQVTIPVHL